MIIRTAAPPVVRSKLQTDTHRPGQRGRWQVTWHTANALEPSTYSHLLEDKHAVVHTLGTLFEGKEYKKAVRDGDVLSLLSSFVRESGTRNPLDKGRGEYEKINTESALRIYETFSQSTPKHDNVRKFVYVSAEDVFSSFISSRYIQSKRNTEQTLTRLAQDATVRPIFIRPGLMYHPHLRPLTTPLAVLLDLSSNILPSNLPSSSLTNLLTIPPLHVDHVAQSIIHTLQHPPPSEPLTIGVQDMRTLLGLGQSQL
ncbi:hypothetical protein FRB99_003900 [Tulasnella sp. 403]|nr:hypothetical protein FRB99_003900 [Tulasnella sp. 403]